MTGFEFDKAGIDLVLIFGSFGRGDYDTVDLQSKRALVNDVDVLIGIQDYQAFKVHRTEVRKYLSEIYATDSIDILELTHPLPLRNRHTIFYADLCFGHKIIFGDVQKAYNYLGDMAPLSISKTDVISMFITRSWAVGYVVSYHKSGKGLESSLVTWRYQLIKLLLAAVDFHMLSEGSYCPKYADKADFLKDECLSNFTDEEKKVLIFIITHFGELKADREKILLLEMIDHHNIVVKSIMYYKLAFSTYQKTAGVSNAFSLVYMVVRLLYPLCKLHFKGWSNALARTFLAFYVLCKKEISTEPNFQTKVMRFLLGSKK